MRAQWIWSPRRGAWLTLYVSDGESYVVVPVEDVGALLLTVGVN